MFTEVELNNYKSFLRERLKLSDLTLLAGLNNSGKSSVIQAFRMLQKSVETGDPALAGHGPLIESRSIASPRHLPIELLFTLRGKPGLFVKIYTDGENTKVQCSRNREIPKISYIGADRLGPKPWLPLFTGASALNGTGEQGQFVFDYISRHERNIVPDSLRHPNSQGATVAFNIEAWLAEISPNIVFRLTTDNKRDVSYAEIDGFRPTNSGFGLSYTLPIIAEILITASSAPDGNSIAINQQYKPLLLIENPEAHLHPQGQTSIGKLIALAINCGIQIIVESHSDHFMDGIRIAVKDKLVPSNGIILYFLKRTADGLTKVESTFVHANGKIDHWPDGFFDQAIKNRGYLTKKAE